MRDFLSKIALCGAIFFCWPLTAQDIDVDIEQMVEQGASQGEIEDYLQQVEERAAKKVDLNAAGRETLEQSGLFTPFQIASLLEYRKEYGSILSMEEVALVDGFSNGFVARIAPFVTLDGGGNGHRESLQIRSRFKYKSGTEGLHQYNRVLMEAGCIKAGLLAESDPGEKPLADYLGWYLSYEKGRFAALAGDYAACFGQGLALWNAFSMTGTSAPSSLLRRPKGVAPYKSADECRALRGLALKYGFTRGWEASLFASAAGVDARLGPNGYTSLPITGYHRTIYEKGCKNAMLEYLAGGNLTFRGDCFQAGMTAVAYSYNEHNARKVTDYNRYQMYDGWMGNLALDALMSRGHWRLFAEAAVDANLHLAAVAGAVLTASYNFEGSVLLRYYDKGYIAPHAGAHSTTSSVSNQYGAAVALLARPFRNLTVASFTEAVRYPWVRYRIDGPSAAVYEKARAEYALKPFTLILQDNYVFQSYDLSHKHSLKGSFKYDESPWKGSFVAGVVLVRRPGESLSGFAAAATAARSFSRGRWSVAASFSYYTAEDYDARVYIYEGDLPGSFSLNYYYGKGIAARCLVKVKVGSHISLSGIAVAAAHFEARFQADINF